MNGQNFFPVVLYLDRKDMSLGIAVLYLDRKDMSLGIAVIKIVLVADSACLTWK